MEPPPARADTTQELYERYSRHVFGFCVNQLGSRDEAEDAVQSTFLNVHRALQRGVTPKAELAWLFKIAHNVCLTRRRSRRRRGRVEAASDLQAMQDVIAAPHHESSDELVRLTDALEHMPDNQRRAILLREWQGLSYHEIGTELKLSQSAVETLIFRARRSLAANLVAPARPTLVARARAALDVGSVLAALRALLEGGAAVKATAAAVAISGAAVVATNPATPLRSARERPTPAPVVVPEPVEAAVVERLGVAPAAPSAADVDMPEVVAKPKFARIAVAPETVAAAPADAAPAPEEQAPGVVGSAAAPAAAVEQSREVKQPDAPAQSAPPGKQQKVDKPKKETTPPAPAVEAAPPTAAQVTDPPAAEPTVPDEGGSEDARNGKDHAGGNGQK